MKTCWYWFNHGRTLSLLSDNLTLLAPTLTLTLTPTYDPSRDPEPPHPLQTPLIQHAASEHPFQDGLGYMDHDTDLLQVGEWIHGHTHT